MSNLLNNASKETEQTDTLHPCPAIRMLITSREKDLGGFSVRRLLPYARQRMVGPWIFFDHMGPADFSPGEGIDVRPHPHIHLATVTYVFEGEILHRDSLGSHQLITPGAINLMVAGRGIVHSERTPDALKETGQRVQALQLWHALPEADEYSDPAFYHYARADIPERSVNDVTVRVMMGTAFDMTSPVKTFAETLYAEARLRAGQTLALPQTEEQVIYVVSGGVQVEDTTIPAHTMAICTPDTCATLQAKEDSHIVIIGGASLGERHIYWNFVSSSKDAIAQAKRDWKAGNFPAVPGDEEDYIPLPDDA